jgi:uncharacterized protein YceH (UPF0502 family)
MPIELTKKEMRVVGCLLEKAITTPDQYPLSLNALMLACNQKSNRDPVVEWDEASVLDVLQGLKKKRLIMEESGFGNRVVKYQHRFCNTEFSELQLNERALGILCVMFLRGPQTPGELRTRTNRLCEFADVAAVERELNAMMTHPAGALVERLAREPGKRETRYRQLFCRDEVGSGGQAANPLRDEFSEDGAVEVTVAAQDRIAALEADVAALKTEVASLRALLESVI